jgi:hypothetical protein
MTPGMKHEPRELWSLPKFSRVLTLPSRSTTNLLLIAMAALVIRSSAEETEIPDYFVSARSEPQTPNPSEPSEERTETSRPSESSQELTEGEVENLISTADRALQRLAQGDLSAAGAFASVFDTTVDYYDEGRKTPQQIAQEKAAIFRNYRSYSTQRIGTLTLNDTGRPDVKWAAFTYRYEIAKKSGAILRGTANARWELQKTDGRVLIIATREMTQRQ